jgi:Pentapeptide repeats (8 copies)
LLAGLIGVGALLTFWLNSRVYRITTRTLEVTEQGHITERYTKAIEQLGQAELAMRLGGIYALERIAKDSERDHPTVVEVLSAFVREESRKRSAPQARQGVTQEAAKADTSAPESEGAARPATDIQAALTVLGRLPHRPEIPRAYLSEAQLSGAWLDGANLSGAFLERAKLSGAQVVKADLREIRDLTQEQLNTAHGDALTLLPDGLQRPDGWAPTRARHHQLLRLIRPLPHDRIMPVILCLCLSR